MARAWGAKKLAAVPVKLSPISLTMQHAAKIERKLRGLVKVRAYS
jgi:hypothetical protein